MLPDLEGFDVAKPLGAAGSGVPIIFLTERDATERQDPWATLGGDDYVTKPFSLEEFVAGSAGILRRSGLAEPESSRLVFEAERLRDVVVAAEREAADLVVGGVARGQEDDRDAGGRRRAAWRPRSPPCRAASRRGRSGRA